MSDSVFFNSCTPFTVNNDRYLKWNSYGIIRHFNSKGQNLINVQFHDTSTHHSLEFNNEQNYLYADLSLNAIVFASTKVFQCQYFSKECEENDWTISIPKGEYIRNICLGENFVAVGTSLNIVRLFTLNGTQKPLFSVPGEIVCLVAQRKSLVIIYKKTLDLPDHQSLLVIVFDVDINGEIPFKQLKFSPITVPISRKSKLYWVGFSDEGSLAIYDNSGSLKLLKNGIAFDWIEIFSLSKQTNKYFIIGLSDMLQQIRCVICSDSNYPNTDIIPIMQTLPFKLNLCNLNDEKTIYEEQNIIHSIKLSMLKQLSDNVVNINSDLKQTLKNKVEALFKIFLDGVKKNKEMQSLDAAKLIPSLKTLDTLISFAQQKNLDDLIPKLLNVKNEINNDEEVEYNLFFSLPSELSVLQKNHFTNEENVELAPFFVNPLEFENLKNKINFENINETNNTEVIEIEETKHKSDFLNEKTKQDSHENYCDLLVKQDVSSLDLTKKNPFKK